MKGQGSTDDARDRTYVNAVLARLDFTDDDGIIGYWHQGMFVVEQTTMPLHLVVIYIPEVNTWAAFASYHAWQEYVPVTDDIVLVKKQDDLKDIKERGVLALTVLKLTGELG